MGHKDNSYLHLGLLWPASFSGDVHLWAGYVQYVYAMVLFHSEYMSRPLSPATFDFTHCNLASLFLAQFFARDLYRSEDVTSLVNALVVFVLPSTIR